MSGNNNFKRWVTAVSKQSGDREKKEQKNPTKYFQRNFFHKLQSGPSMTNKTKPNKKKPTLKLEVVFVLCRKDDGSM